MTASACLFLGIFGMAACSDKNPGSPVPTSTTAQASTTSAVSTSDQPTTSGAELPSDGAPRVQTPLQADKFINDPCATLTAAQASELEVDSKSKKTDTGIGQRCSWRNLETGSDVSILFVEANHRGLSGVYQARTSFELFEDIPPVAGFPAVIAGHDDRASGGCTIYVGVTDQVTFQLGTQQSSNKVGTTDACSVSTKVATMMIQTMKAGS